MSMSPFGGRSESFNSSLYQQPLRNDKSSDGVPNYIQHAEKKKRAYDCDQCNKTFKQISNLKVHVRTHTGERPFECEICKKKFTQMTHLKKHNQIHTGERPHVCEYCEKSFTTMSNLKTHLRLHFNDKPYTCEMCHAMFRQSVHLRHHRQLHLDSRQYSCSTCGKKFVTPSRLQNHCRMVKCEKKDSRKSDKMKDSTEGASENQCLHNPALNNTYPFLSANSVYKSYHMPDTPLFGQGPSGMIDQQAPPTWQHMMYGNPMTHMNQPQHLQFQHYFQPSLFGPLPQNGQQPQQWMQQPYTLEMPYYQQ